MKVIFLDVDGVLNDWGCGGLTNEKWYDEKYMEQLRLLVQNTDALIVVSSTWKYSIKMLGKLAKALEEHGMAIYDVTPDCYDKRVEIQAYLSQHKDIENYVVLDDDDYTKEFGKHMVRTLEYLRMGLDEQWRLKAQEILS